MSVRQKNQKLPELGHFVVAKRAGMKVEEFGFGFPPRLWGIKRGETIYSINWIPFGGFVKIHGEHAEEGEKLEEPERSFTHQIAWKRSIIIVAGAFMNFLIGWVAFSLVFAMGVPNRVLIERVVPNSPAEIAGFQVGQSLEGFASAEEFLAFVNDRKGESVVINETSVELRENPPEGEGSLGIVIVDVGIEKKGVFASIPAGFTTTLSTTKLIAVSFVGFIGSLFAGDFDVVDEVTGPVGIFGILGDVSELGIAPLAQFLGLISINLVVINLIPFPALDGGRFLAILVEKIIGRRLGHKFELFANAIGLTLLLTLMVVVTIKDIINIL